jgi:hypothetical protein
MIHKNSVNRTETGLITKQHRRYRRCKQLNNGHVALGDGCLEFRFVRPEKKCELRSLYISNQSVTQFNYNADGHVFSLITETMPKYEGNFNLI